MEELLSWFNPEKIIQFGGIWILLAMVFLETGIFFGFFLPGDSLLFTAGLLTSAGVLKLPLAILLVSLVIASVAGTWAGYVSGQNLLRIRKGKKDNFFFRRRYLVKARQFHRHYGSFAMILGKFFPVIRTFLPILAGLVKMSFRQFMVLNLAGSVLWIMSLVGAGFYLGQFFPEIQEYLEWIIAGMVLVTALPFAASRFLGNNQKKRNKTYAVQTEG